MSGSEERETRPAEPTIVVPGVGRLTVEPDVATIRLGVAITRPTATAAREASAATMTAILDALAATGVDRRDMRTSLIGLGPLTDYSPDGGQRVTGYQMTNLVELTVRDVTAVGGIIDAALLAGATSVDGLEFRLDDPTAAREQARRSAVADARARATTLADAAGVSLGAVIGIVEGGRPGPMAEHGGVAGLAMKAFDTPVEAGTHELSVALVVTFLIEGG